MKEILGKPWLAVLSKLTGSGVRYVTKLTGPPRPSKIFPVDGDNLYVLRVKLLSDGVTEITLAARMASREPQA